MHSRCIIIYINVVHLSAVPEIQFKVLLGPVFPLGICEPGTVGFYQTMAVSPSHVIRPSTCSTHFLGGIVSKARTSFQPLWQEVSGQIIETSCHSWCRAIRGSLVEKKLHHQAKHIFSCPTGLDHMAISFEVIMGC